MNHSWIPTLRKLIQNHKCLAMLHGLSEALGIQWETWLPFQAHFHSFNKHDYLQETGETRDK